MITRTDTCVRIVAAVAALCVSFTAHAQWQNTLKPKGKPSGPVTIVAKGKTQGAIQLPPRPTTQEKKAATDLQHWICEITGTTVPISSGRNGRACVEIRTDRSLGDEGYAIAVRDKHIVLSGGKTRGPVNAVYALLEEDLGCRFYTKDSVLLPTTETLVIAPVARRKVPQLKLRDPYYACAFDPTWSLRNRTNAPEAAVTPQDGGHISYGGMFVHTAAQLVPVDKYSNTHPEYFALQPDGKRASAALCATHPDVARIAIAHVLQVLKDNPQAQIVSVSKNDCPIICHCDRCKKLRDAEGSDMANQLVLVNKVADAVAKKHPDVTIDTLAYLETIQVPKTIRPHKNVAIRLCNDSVGSWSRPFTPAEQCDIAKLISAWSAVHKRIYIWDYNVNFSHYLAPMPNLSVIAANIRFWMKNHAEGVMLQGGYQGPAEQDELKCWVSAKLMLDPTLDERELEKDFLLGYYGKAAEPLVAYTALLNRAAIDYANDMKKPSGGIRYPMDTSFISKDFVSSSTALLTEAKKLAGGDADLTRRVERAELPILYVKCVRGPEFTGDSYAQVVRDFERIARRENVRALREGSPDLDEQLAKFKSQIPKAPAAQ